MAASKPQHPPLLLLTGSALTGQMVCGVSAWVRSNTPWNLLVATNPESQDLQALEPTALVGTIVAGSPRCLKPLVLTSKPVVTVDDDQDTDAQVGVRTDLRAAGQMACEHFLEKSFHYVGYLGDTKGSHQTLFQGFLDRLPRERVCMLEQPHVPLDLQTQPYPQALDRVGQWLKQAPHPCAILTGDDRYGVLVMQAARLAGLRVPEDVAVLGVGDDPCFNEAGPVPLSSIALGHYRMGYEAARLLELLVRGERVSCPVVRVPPEKIVVRRSTETTVVRDPEVLRAMEWIAGHLSEPFRIDELAGELSLSRSSLERRFKKYLGRTPLEEVLRQRIERARWLLVETDWDLKRVAMECGFGTREYFGNMFRRETGQSPAAYRKGLFRRNAESKG